MSRYRKRRIVRRTMIAFLIALVVIAKLYLVILDYYHATEAAMECVNNPAEGITVENDNKVLVFSPENPKTGLIFYPGGLVEPEAYAPLMEQLAENGIKCILIKMPQYLAIFDANGARGIQARNPEIEKWYLGGHSLGGAMASMYGNLHSDEYEGLVFLAAYATDDLTDDDIDVLLVRGDQDGVLNMERYNECLKNLPSDYQEYIIKGGCHAYFGDYGHQIGDGQPTITVEEQTRKTVEKLVDFME